ncbi:MAG: hypothetical protein LBR18_01100, partial [Tannerella sp.]|nr:hypothetical protein [Tannerella sp.]
MSVAEYTVTWLPAPEKGVTKLDAAVQLIDNSTTCITTNVIDSTTWIGQLASADSVLATGRIQTNALITVPFKDRFTIRTKGNFYANLDNERDSITSRRILYTQTTFPDPDPQVYLMPDANGVHTGSYANNNSLVSYNDGGGVFVYAAPYNTPKGSIFGVYGSYDFDGLMANIHTISRYNGTDPDKTNAPGSPNFDGLTTNKGNDNQGVIEIGDGSAIGRVVATGYEHFHIYSGGTLKNFESCNGPTQNFSLNFSTTDNTPVFYLDTLAPLYVLNFGNNQVSPTIAQLADADINWWTPGITKLTNAITNSKDSGALHIQAAGDLHFYNAFKPSVTAAAPTEIRLLSDNAGIQFLDSIWYINDSDTNFVIWAKGGEEHSRECIDDTLYAGSGEVLFDKLATIEQNKKGNTLIRSEYDDVFIRDTFRYTNSTTADSTGELRIQAGQDIYGLKPFNLISGGQRPMLLEAKNTIHFRDSVIIAKTPAAATRDSVTFKAGYNNFSTSANVTSWSLRTTPNAYNCTLNNYLPSYYPSRNGCGYTEGADIWLEGPVKIDYSAVGSLDSITTLLRAYNSVYIDTTFEYTRSVGTGLGDGYGTGPTLIFAETGNVEAIAMDDAEMKFSIGTDDSSLLLIQAGNKLNPADVIDNGICLQPTDFSCWNKGSAAGAQYDGNILFANKLTIESAGTGERILSAARDIENQVGGKITISVEEQGLRPGNVLLTAGRHVETHAPVELNDMANQNDTVDFTIQAGRLDDGTYLCSDILCKAVEYGTTLTADAHGGNSYDPYSVIAAASFTTEKNLFAEGGSGHGSILAFDSVSTNYSGAGTVLLTALNGNIESDPYLHRPIRTSASIGASSGYDAVNNVHKAPIIFNNYTSGVTRMEAINIKLHDKLDYTAVSPEAQQKNGQLQIFAYDSILTRNIKYLNNQGDTGSVFITTAKYKATGASTDCSLPGCLNGDGGIYQGHIVLGYGADAAQNINDSIIFDYNSGRNNNSVFGSNIYILAGFEGYQKNSLTGVKNSGNLFNINTDPKDKGKAYGGNITFDYTEFWMARG